MGEQGHSFASGHIWSPAMRSSRGKFCLYISVIGGMCLIMFLLSNAHRNMKQLEGVSEKCQQQRDSLSAQLQVVYEHKNRLEKSLQQEKTDHRQTKEENDKQTQEQEVKLQKEKDKTRALENELTQLKASFSELELDKKHAETIVKDQIQTLRKEKEQEIKKLQAQVVDVTAQKESLERNNSALAWHLEEEIRDSKLCRLQKDDMEQVLRDCTEKLKVPRENVLPPQDRVLTKATVALDTKKKVSVSSPPSVPSAGKEKNVLERPQIQPPEDNNNKGNVIAKPPSQNNEFLAAEKSQLDKNDSLNIMLKNQLPAPFHAESENGPLKKSSPASNNEAQDLNLNQLGPAQPLDSLNPAAERGEYGNALAGQVEQPDFRNANIGGAYNMKRSNVPSMNYYLNEQVKDMMEKNPGDAANEESIRKSPHVFAIPNRINQLEANFLKPQGEVPPLEDKHYADEEEDDQDGENDEDSLGAGGGGQGPREKQHFQENDFDDQESNDVNANAGEGVMLAPK